MTQDSWNYSSKRSLFFAAFAIQTLSPSLAALPPGNQELLLVYEFVPNGTVADHLHRRKGSEALTWTLRMQIIIETARVLAYLHCPSRNPPVIHGDIKTDNILLDNTFHVKVADFGLCSCRCQMHAHNHKTPRGTEGYLDPLYYRDNKLTLKSDVYSFGVVMLELISGKEAVDVTRNCDDIYLVEMGLRKIQNNKLDQLVDKRLGYHSDQDTQIMIKSVAQLAFRCLHPEGNMRPSMEEVSRILKEIRGVIIDVVEPSEAISPWPTHEGSANRYMCTFCSKTILRSLYLRDKGFYDELERLHRLRTPDNTCIVLQALQNLRISSVMKNHKSHVEIVELKKDR